MAVTALKDVSFSSGVPVATYDSSFSGYKIDLGANDRIYRNGTQMIVPCQYACCGVMFWGQASYACNSYYACCASESYYACFAKGVYYCGSIHPLCADTLSNIQASYSCAKILFYVY